MPDHPHTIDRWDDATGENLVEQIAAVGDYLVAMQTYLAAVRRWPDAKITLRNRTRVLERSWED
jgi:hypothetical protein